MVRAAIGTKQTSLAFSSSSFRSALHPDASRTPQKAMLFPGCVSRQRAAGGVLRRQPPARLARLSPARFSVPFVKFRAEQPRASIKSVGKLDGAFIQSGGLLRRLTDWLLSAVSEKLVLGKVAFFF